MTTKTFRIMAWALLALWGLTILSAAALAQERNEQAVEFFKEFPSSKTTMQRESICYDDHMKILDFIEKNDFRQIVYGEDLFSTPLVIYTSKEGYFLALSFLKGIEGHYPNLVCVGFAGSDLKLKLPSKSDPS